MKLHNSNNDIKILLVKVKIVTQILICIDIGAQAGGKINND